MGIYQHPREFIKYGDKLNTENNKSLIIINAKIKGSNQEILIDTGSEISLISDKIIKQLKLENLIFKLPKITLVGANDKKLCEVNKGIILQLQFLQKEYSINFFIIDKMNYDIVLGNDELDRCEMIIDYLRGRIQIREELIQFKKKIMNNEKENNHKLCSENNIINNMKMFEVKKLDNLEVNEVKNMNNEEGCKKKSIISTIYDMNKIDCQSDMKENVINILKKYKSLINEENRIAKKYVHKLQMRKIDTYKVKTYPIPYKYKNEVNNEIKKMLNNKIIEKCNSRYINPMVVVMKSNGEIRLCLDARNINKYTIPQYESPMNIQGIFGRITNANIFTKLDLKHSFWLIPLDIDSRDYTAFSIDGVLYRFRVVPYGLQSSCAALVRALHSILDQYDHFVVHYVDDILIYSCDEQVHLKHIKIVLEELATAGLKINLDKCQFFKKIVTFLGFKINETGIQMDEERIKIIQEYKRPYNLKTLRGFLGLINYFRKLIPDISEKEIPLIKLIKKGNHWNWGEEQQKAFESLKKEFIKNIMIYHPQYDKPFVLRTDASINKLAGVLIQEQDNREVPICFVSRVTKEYEKKMGITELEFASIIFCIMKLRFYLLGTKFIIETDHSSLINVMNNRYLNNRIHRGALLLQEYNFEIRYITGKTNVVADALTRDEIVGTKQNKKLQVGLNILKDKHGIFSEDRIREDQKEIPVEEIKKCVKIRDIYIRKINENELYFISEQLSKEIIIKIHIQYGHLGVRKTWLIFRENYYCKKDLGLIKQIIRRCEICQLCKNRNFKNHNFARNIVANEILDIICIDFIGEFISTERDKRYIFVVLDYFSKYIKLYATKTTKVYEIKQKLNSYITEVGKPKICILDNATYFNNNRFKSYCNQNDIKLNFTSIRHPQSNPVERYIQEVNKFLRILVQNNHREWDVKIQEIEQYFNNVPNTVTEETPIYIMFRKQPERKWVISENRDYDKILHSVRNKIIKNGEKYLKRMNKRKFYHNVKFEIGELVLVRANRVSNLRQNICKKLLPPFEGPYKIVNDNGKNSYQLSNLYDGSIRGIYHINDIYKFY